MVYVIEMYLSREGVYDPTWYAATTVALGNIEVHLAVVCASLPVFWPNLERVWNKIFVMQEVSVKVEYGHMSKRVGDVELQSISSNKNQPDDPSKMPDGWEPFVGDETTGLGENETVVESTSKRSWKMKVRSLKDHVLGGGSMKSFTTKTPGSK
jgi:hypothetical protein